MDESTKGLLSTKLLEACGCGTSSTVYTFVPHINKELWLYTHNLHILPQIIDSAIDIFALRKIKVPKNSIYHANLKNNQEELIGLYVKICDSLGYKEQKKIGQNKIEASLSAVSHLYFDSFTMPIQFFLPHSSICSGKWDFWDSIDFFAFNEKLQDKEFNFNFRERITKSKVWNAKFDLREFPMLVQRRIIKERLLYKNLNPEAMIKAIIIRLGEMGRPFINYEVIDFSIREFFTYLGAKKYQRADRETEFLKRLDDEIISIIKKNL